MQQLPNLHLRLALSLVDDGGSFALDAPTTRHVCGGAPCPLGSWSIIVLPVDTAAAAAAAAAAPGDRPAAPASSCPLVRRQPHIVRTLSIGRLSQVNLTCFGRLVG